MTAASENLLERDAARLAAKRDERRAAAVACGAHALHDGYTDLIYVLLPVWQREICERLRDVVHRADPEIVETIKRSVQPYFVLDGSVCAVLAAKTHVNLFLYDGGILPDPDRIITGGHGNKTARTISYQEGERIRSRPLTVMLRQIVANNRAGGWRKLKRP